MFYDQFTLLNILKEMDDLQPQYTPPKLKEFCNRSTKALLLVYLSGVTHCQGSKKKAA